MPKANESAAIEERKPGHLWSRWLPAILGALALIVIGLLIWIIPVGRTIIKGTDQRNQTDLAIAATGLERWSGAVAGLARANFVTGLAQPLPASERDYTDGWRYRSWLRHPTLDEFKLTYVVTTRKNCEGIARAIEEREGILPFVTNYNDGNAGFLKLVDSFPLEQIRNEDQRSSRNGSKDNSTYLKTIDPGSGPVPGDAVVCFSAGIPIDRLLVLDKAARGFSNLLIIDARDRVVAQIGAERLPVKSLAGMVPETSVLARTLAVSSGQSVPSAAPAPRIADSLKPVDIDIGGRSYIAYIRPLSPPGSFTACRPAAAGTLPAIVTASGGGGNTITVSTPAAALPKAGEPASGGTAGAAQQPANGCLMVAFMPRTTLWKQIVDIPLAVLVLVGIGVVAVVALLPSLRLILLGPGEAIGRAEAIGVVLGLPAIVSMATLALLLVIDIGSHRTAAERRAETIAKDAARVAAAQVRKAVAVIDAAGQARSPETFPGKIARLDMIAGPRSAIEARPVSAARARPGLDADPVPKTWPKDFCWMWNTSRLPVVDSLGLIDEDGRQLTGSQTVACREYFGGRTNVSARNYFLRLRNGHPSLTDGLSPQSGTPYVVAQVSALQDGVSKSVIAMKTGLSNPDAPHRRQHRDSVYVVGTATLTTVIAPVLPPAFNLMVIDTRDDALPVLLHTTPGRSGAERLIAMVRNPDSVRDQLRGLHLAPLAGGNTRPSRFRSYYDGADRRFVAMPVAGTRWAAVVYYSTAEIDREAADTALHALRTWAAFSILFTLAWTGWLVWQGSHGWPRLWPQEAQRQRYRHLSKWFALLALAGVAIVLAVGAVVPMLVVLIGLLVRLAAAVLLHWDLGRGQALATAAGPLRPETERRYKLMLFGLIGCLSVVPMLGFWREAHEHNVEEYRRSSYAVMTGTDGALESNRRMLARLRWAYGLPDPEMTPDAATSLPGAYGVRLVATPPPKTAADASGDAGFSFSGFFDELAGRATVPSVASCPLSPADADVVVLCQDRRPKASPHGIVLPEPGWRDTLNWGLVMALLAAAAFALAFNWLLRRVLRGLAGFGVPLEAFDLPVLFVADLWGRKPPHKIDGRQVVTLNLKSLLVNAPYIILPILRMGGVRLKTINVADPQLVIEPLVENMVMVVTGIELVLADRDRRLRALNLLEQQSAALAQLGIHTRSRLVILSEAAPLERILDAFERDEARTTIDSDRENLRWSRLFEDFATYNFRQSQLTGSPRLRKYIAAVSRGRPGQRAIIAAACAELRWLPQRVAAGAIGEELRLDDKYLQDGVVPIADSVFQARFERPIMVWAARRQFPGKQAVWSHVRNQCIEYYQKLWSSSTHAEHLVMHHLAASRFVNIGTALAFASLVRRGIIVFDPEPRLMNQSFAMFVRQAEKLDTIRGWQKDLPRSAWVTARLPIFAFIGLAVAGLATVVALSGEDVTSLLPVLAAGIPALIAATQRLFNRA